MNSDSNNTFCSYPFRELAIKMYDANKLQAAWPCCMMGNRTSENHTMNKLGIKNLENLTPDEIFNHPRMNQLRENLLNGVRDEACSVCWEQEDKNLISFRQFSTRIDDHDIKNVRLQTLDLTTGNVCNLRCRMCAPLTSNSLMIDQKYFKEHNLDQSYSEASGNWSSVSSPITVTDSLQWQWLMKNTDKITTIKASGGEPFYDKRVIDLLDTYIKNNHARKTTLRFHTNGTMLSDELIEKLNLFEANEHTFSIDGFDKTYDYIRHPAKFSDIDSMLRNYIQKLRNLSQLHVALVVSSLNLLSLVDFIKWVKTLKRPGEFYVYMHFAEINPGYRGTHISRLPVKLLQRAFNELEEFNSDHAVLNLQTMIKNAMVSNQEDKSRMLAEIIPFDRSRQQSYKDYLDSELVDWLSS